MNSDVHVQMAASSLLRALFDKLKLKRSPRPVDPANHEGHRIPNGKPTLRLVRNTNQTAAQADQ